MSSVKDDSIKEDIPIINYNNFLFAEDQMTHGYENGQLYYICNETST